MRVDPSVQVDDFEHDATRIVIAAQDLAVRNGLKALFEQAPLCDLSEDDRGTAEIVLAEALNNIVEHAYADYQGDIEILISHGGNKLCCRIADDGLPMPGGKLPGGALPALDDPENLPEGGFGWHMIRSLSKDLCYQRLGSRNLLSFHLETEQSQE